MSQEEKNLDTQGAHDDDLNQIPMADEGDEVGVDEDDMEGRQTPTAMTTPSSYNHQQDRSLNLLDGEELSGEEQEEKARLIAQVLELQNTLDDLSSRVDNVKEENLRLRSENQVLGQYIENLMNASSVFQPANGDPQASRGPQRKK